MHELRHGVERKLTRVCDQLGKLRDEAVDESGHRAVCFGVVMRHDADRVVDQVTVLNAPRLGKLSRCGVAESAAQEVRQVVRVGGQESGIARVLIGVVHRRSGLLGDDHHVLGEQQVELSAQVRGAV